MIIDEKKYIEATNLLKSELDCINNAILSDRFCSALKKTKISYGVKVLRDAVDRYKLYYTCTGSKINFSYHKNYDTNTTSYLTSKNRVTIKLGRFIAKFLFLEDYVSDYIVKNLSAKIISIDEFGNLVKIVRGQDIVNHYASTLIKTCMTGSDNTKKIMFYADNPEKVGLLTVESFGCRALVWTADCGTNILDRIYPAGHALVPTIRRWAKEKKYELRRSPDQYERFNHGDIKTESNKLFKITMKDNGIYPFADTFVFAEKCPNDRKIVLSNEYAFGNMVLQNQYGAFIMFHKCEVCGKKVIDGEQQTFSINPGVYASYCYDCYVANIVKCACCYRVFFKKDAIQVNTSLETVSSVCKACSATFIKCDICERHHRKNNIKHIEDKNICNSCYPHHYKKCKACSKTYKISEEFFTTKHASKICKACNENLIYCDCCGAEMFNDKFKVIDNTKCCLFCSKYKEDSRNQPKQQVDYLTDDDYQQIIAYINVAKANF